MKWQDRDCSLTVTESIHTELKELGSGEWTGDIMHGHDVHGPEGLKAVGNRVLPLRSARDTPESTVRMAQLMHCPL